MLGPQDDGEKVYLIHGELYVKGQQDLQLLDMRMVPKRSEALGLHGLSRGRRSLQGTEEIKMQCAEVACGS